MWYKSERSSFLNNKKSSNFRSHGESCLCKALYMYWHFNQTHEALTIQHLGLQRAPSMYAQHPRGKRQPPSLLVDDLHHDQGRVTNIPEPADLPAMVGVGRDALNSTGSAEAFWRIAKPHYWLVTAVSPGSPAATSTPSDSSPKLDTESKSAAATPRRKNRIRESLMTERLFRCYGKDVLSHALTFNIDLLYRKTDLTIRHALECWRLHISHNKFSGCSTNVKRMVNKTLVSAIRMWKQHAVEPNPLERQRMRLLENKALVHRRKTQLTKCFSGLQGLSILQGLKKRSTDSWLHEQLKHAQLEKKKPNCHGRSTLIRTLNQEPRGSWKRTMSLDPNTRRSLCSASTKYLNRTDKAALEQEAALEMDLRNIFERIQKSRSAYQVLFPLFLA